MAKTSGAALSETEITGALDQLPHWSYTDSRLQREYLFKDFLSALNWMHELAPEIDKLDHHPLWTNVYNRVQIQLWSHDVDAITQRDLRLASMFEVAFTKRSGT
jgi:4a-hydroxytetrahydrobiopterin dehydratase